MAGINELRDEIVFMYSWLSGYEETRDEIKVKDVKERLEKILPSLKGGN